MRIAVRSIASISGATSSTAFLRGLPFGVRLGGADGAVMDRYLRTVLWSRPVSGYLRQADRPGLDQGTQPPQFQLALRVQGTRPETFTCTPNLPRL